ncbi:hypothetical protein C8F01DRAFT_1370743 [Mycena amicta]|nr:hypothetical protein C8F01DRAFT_1370743 [Mycena amicta]
MLLLLALAVVLPTKYSESSGVPLISFTTRSASEDACKDIDSCRKLFDIVWGCLVTVFACIWVAVHPNVPPPPPSPLPKGSSLWHQVKWRVIDSQGPLRSRLKLMLVGLLAPEFIAGFAGRQLVAAWYFSKEYDVSLTHGFFICMGGFVDKDRHPIVTSAQINHPEVLSAIQRTTEAAIQDKSKGDVFSKGIAFFQGLWFVLQCIARAAQHLPLTELEVATLAFAVVNILTWLLWWSKPLDIRDPLVIEISSNGTPPPQEPRTWWNKFRTLLGGNYDREDYNPLANNAVPTFWCTSYEDDDALDMDYWALAFFGEFLVATIFGAIHCIAWHSAFPSNVEMWLWQISAVLVTGVPVAVLVIAGLASYSALFFVSALVYILGRLILLVLPFTALRAVSPATFVDVNWSVYIPHL